MYFKNFIFSKKSAKSDRVRERACRYWLKYRIPEKANGRGDDWGEMDITEVTQRLEITHFSWYNHLAASIRSEESRWLVNTD